MDEKVAKVEGVWDGFLNNYGAVTCALIELAIVNKMVRGER